jgi:hypothetical protein
MSRRMTLKTKIHALADTFATEVLAAIRAASLEEILDGGSSSGGAVRRGPGRPPKAAAAAAAPGAAPKAKRGRGRPARRSAADIAPVIARIVAKLKEHKSGLRSEQLQKVLHLSKREIVRPIADALAAKKITKKGEKRSTTYFAK